MLLVEDIVDTGLTLRYLLDLLQARGPAGVHVCALLAKPSYQSSGGAASTSSASTRPTPSWSATAWTPRQLYRNLPYIGALDAEA